MRGKDMKKVKEPRDMSVYEASDYWDEHDVTEFKDVEEVRELRFVLKKKKYVGVDVGLYIKIKEKAKKLHTTEDTLVDEWLREKVG
jgi:hypothetical protein